MKRLAAMIGLALGLNATTIDFEGSPGGVTASAGYSFGYAVPTTSLLDDEFWEAHGVRFSSNGTGSVALIALGAGHATSGINGIGALTSSGTLDYSLPVTISFYQPGTLVAATFNYVTIRGDQFPVPANTSVTYRAFDIGGNLLATRTVADGSGGLYGFASSDGFNIHRFEIWSSSPPDAYSGFPGWGSFGRVALDDLTFRNDPTSSMPEPSTALAVLAGCALVAAMRQR
jgi:hypothetical protein